MTGFDYTSWHTYKIVTDSSGTSYQIDGIEKGKLTGLGDPGKRVPVGIQVNGKMHVYIDWVKVTPSNITTTDGNICGYIGDASGLPISGATIYTDTGILDITDSTGYFMLSVPSGKSIVTIDAEGYRKQVENVEVSNFSDITRNLTLIGVDK